MLKKATMFRRTLSRTCLVYDCVCARASVLACVFVRVRVRGEGGVRDVCARVSDMASKYTHGGTDHKQNHLRSAAATHA